MYLRAAPKQNLENSNSIWYHVSSKALFIPTMSLNRLIFITRFIQFDDRDTQERCKRCDKFVCVQEEAY